MSVIPMTNGMLGKAEVNMFAKVPSAGFFEENTDRPPAYKSEPISVPMYTKNIDYSTRRNVLPCKGLGHIVLRAEPPPAAAGMIAPTGNGRHQPRGLAQEKPTNLPIMPFSDPYASGLNNKLGRPN